MENSVFLAVFTAAFLHALWNFLVKNNADKAMAMGAVALGHVPFCLAGLLWSGLPTSDALIFIIISAFLHSFYQIFLMNAYRFGGLSQIYPIARGLSPLLLVIATFFIGQDALQISDIIGIIFVSVSLIIFGFIQFRFDENGPKGLMLALMTGLFIASYSMIDALGVRITGQAAAFYGVMSTVNAFIMFLYLSVWHRPSLVALAQRGKTMFWLGGGASYFAYVLVLWACLHAPVAVVSSLRETSVLFAMFLAVLFLGEKLSPIRIIASLMVVGGIIIMRLF